MKTASIIALASLLVQPFAAAYTYVDATPKNTTLDGAALVAGTNYVVGIGTGTDGLWSYRSDITSFEGGTYFESDAGSGAGDLEATRNLVTELTLPSPGSYELVALFTKANNRDVAAKLSTPPGAQDIFTIANGGSATALLWDASYTGGRTTSAGAVALGTVVTTTANTKIYIYINGFESTVGVTDDERTQYDGIGYQFTAIAPTVSVHRDVFILAGQSNADGRGTASELVGELAPYAQAQPTVLINYTNPAYSPNLDQSRYKKWVPLAPGYSVASSSNAQPLPLTTFGPEIGIGKVLAEHYPHPALIKVTRGGTSLTLSGNDWYPAAPGASNAGPLYTALIQSTKLALQQLTDAGDTYTVHALFWHQGESDSSRSTTYATLYPLFVSNVRRDLGLPNLRFITGQLAPNRDPTFENVQWQLSRTLNNLSFVSSETLTTLDAQTHFNTGSMIIFGQRYGNTALDDYTKINFDAPSFALWPIDRQADFTSTDATQPMIVATTTQGAYLGGQAVGHVGSSASNFLFSRRGILPLASLHLMQADFFAGDVGYDNDGTANSRLQIRGWMADSDQNGLYSESEAGIGFGLETDGRFAIRAGAQIIRSTGGLYQTDHWYRLTLEWTDPNSSGDRVATLRVHDLLTNTELNAGQPLVQAALRNSDFGGDPANWFGIGFNVSRGLLDNVSAEPPGYEAWSRRYPALTGARGDDDDGDGIPNLAEYALGLNPTVPDSSAAQPMPVVGASNVTLTITPPPRLVNVLYEVDWSADLVNWTTLTGVKAGSNLNFSVPLAPKIFMRRKFTDTP